MGKVDRAYENTPVGYPVCGSDIRLMDEESLFLLFEDVGRAYYGEKLEADSCFALLREELEPAFKRKRKKDAVLRFGDEIVVKP